MLTVNKEWSNEELRKQISFDLTKSKGKKTASKKRFS